MQVRIEQETNYPTSGNVDLKVELAAAASFEVKLRIPRWCANATVSINGEAAQVVNGGRFHSIQREWKPGDRIELKMPMTFRFVRGRRAQYGRAAILRGPSLFTFNPHRNPEIADIPDFQPNELKIYPAEIDGPKGDDSIRPDGVSCTVNGWPPQAANPFPFASRSPIELTEYPDPHGEAIYFIVPGSGDSMLVPDELFDSQ
jgi:hypothetical protein